MTDINLGTPPGITAPRIEDAIVRGPEALRPPLTPPSWTPEPRLPEADLAVQPKPWYRRRRPVIAVIAAVAAVLAGGITALVLTVFAPSGPVSPQAVLKADGYPVTMNLTPDQFGQIGQSEGASNGDIAAMKPFITGVAVGFKNGNAEEVFGLTSAGSASASANQGSLSNLGGSIPAGSGIKVRMEHGDIVITGTVKAFVGAGITGVQSQ
jgi:hypothetical protein